MILQSKGKCTYGRESENTTVSMKKTSSSLKFPPDSQKIGFPVCKKENFAGLQAHRKRGKSARASPTPHHTLNEERSARFTAQPLSALVTLESEESDEDDVLTEEELKKTEGYNLTMKGLDAMLEKPQS
ncbi:unnamed protein product [Porites evermanni]|uniref:Uncharacterized protein n=1 Tax=Porites evermanni TaxID=104178 RepID=A0ABN8QDH3_9CNID|nr:unnamed protein product [Porites evermanni]